MIKIHLDNVRQRAALARDSEDCQTMKESIQDIIPLVNTLELVLESLGKQTEQAEQSDNPVERSHLGDYDRIDNLIRFTLLSTPLESDSDADTVI